MLNTFINLKLKRIKEQKTKKNIKNENIKNKNKCKFITVVCPTSPRPLLKQVRVVLTWKLGFYGGSEVLKGELLYWTVLYCTVL